MSLVMRKQSSGFPTRSDTNWAVQSQNMARGLKFRIQKGEGVYYPLAKTKALISFTVTTKLICVFVFAYAKAGFLTMRVIQLQVDRLHRECMVN